MSLKLSRTKQGKPNTRPPSCTTPQQPTIDELTPIPGVVLSNAVKYFKNVDF